MSARLLVVVAAFVACTCGPKPPPDEADDAESTVGQVLRAIETVDSRSSGSDEADEPELIAALCPLDIDDVSARVSSSDEAAMMFVRADERATTPELWQGASMAAQHTKLEAAGKSYRVRVDLAIRHGGVMMMFTPADRHDLDAVAALLRRQAPLIGRDDC